MAVLNHSIDKLPAEKQEALCVAFAKDMNPEELQNTRLEKLKAAVGYTLVSYSRPEGYRGSAKERALTNILETTNRVLGLRGDLQVRDNDWGADLVSKAFMDAINEKYESEPGDKVARLIADLNAQLPETMKLDAADYNQWLQKYIFKETLDQEKIFAKYKDIPGDKVEQFIADTCEAIGDNTALDRYRANLRTLTPEQEATVAGLMQRWDNLIQRNAVAELAAQRG